MTWDSKDIRADAVYPTRNKVAGDSRMYLFCVTIAKALCRAYQGFKTYRAEAKPDANMVNANRALTNDSQANGGMLMSSVKDVKRRSERLSLTAPIFCLMTLAEETGNYVVVLNVSNEGVRIMSPSVVSAKPGDDVLLWLGKPDRSKMQVRAVIRWRERQECGLEFAA